MDSDDGRKKRRGRKHEEESEESEDDSDEDRPKKRGRPRAPGKNGVKGFADAEVRRFVKSFKKFGHPKERSVSIGLGLMVLLGLADGGIFGALQT